MYERELISGFGSILCYGQVRTPCMSKPKMNNQDQQHLCKISNFTANYGYWLMYIVRYRKFVSTLSYKNMTLWSVYDGAESFFIPRKMFILIQWLKYIFTLMIRDKISRFIKKTIFRHLKTLVCPRKKWIDEFHWFMGEGRSLCEHKWCV